MQAVKQLALGTIVGAVTLAALVAAAPPEVVKGHAARPLEAAPLSEAIPADSIRIYKDSEFDGSTELLADVTAQPAGALQHIPGEPDDELSSLRWSLKPGIIVILFENADGDGEQLVLWGEGEHSSVAMRGFNDKASRWAWYRVDPALGAVPSAAALPAYVQPLTEQLDDMTIRLYKDKEFEGDSAVISPITSQAARTPHRISDDLADQMTSLRWKLPKGVVVILYEDAKGEGRQHAIWGEGECTSASDWDFNDRVSRWAWFYVGGVD